MSENEELYTEDQVKAYGEEMVRQSAQEKANVHSFFTKIIQNPETTRIGNVTEDELGSPQITIRGLKELEVFSKDIETDSLWAGYFSSMAEATTSTSLSKEGFLIRQSQTQKKELADTTPKRKANKGWFRKGQSESTE